MFGEEAEAVDPWESWVDQVWEEFDGDGSNDLDMDEMVRLIEHTFEQLDDGDLVE